MTPPGVMNWGESFEPVTPVSDSQLIVKNHLESCLWIS